MYYAWIEGKVWKKMWKYVTRFDIYVCLLYGTKMDRKAVQGDVDIVVTRFALICYSIAVELGDIKKVSLC